MRYLRLATIGILWGGLLSPTESAIPVKNSAEYLVASSTISADPIIQATADITFVNGDIPIPDGKTFDLNGFTVTLPDMLKEPTKRRGFALGDGSSLINGNIRNGGWVAYRFGGTTKTITLADIKATNIQGLIKLGAGNSGVTKGVVIQRCRAELTPEPGTIIDLGPGPIETVYISDVRTHCDYVGTNTGSDGIGIELAYGTVTIENTVIDGCLGDAYDVKGTATITNCVAINSSRQAFKVWGRPGQTTTFDNCIAIDCGYGSMINAGNAIVKNCFLQGGWRDNYAMMFGGGKEYVPGLKDQWGHPNDYGAGGVDAVVTNSSFIQRKGVSRLIEAEKENTTLNVRAATAKFDGCTFYLPTHPHIFVGPWVQYVTDAKAGRWNPNITNSKYGDVPDPVIPDVLPPLPPIVEPPIVVPPVDPPIVVPPEITLDEVVAKMEARIVSLETKLDYLRYLQQQDGNTFSMLLNALKNREVPVQ